MTETKRLVLRDLIKRQEAIWVINNTGNPDISDRPGNVVMQVEESSITIPPGADPICISDQTDYESLKKCRDLFKLIESGALTLLDPEKAEEYYAQNTARRKIVKAKQDREKNRVPIAPEAPKAIENVEQSVRIDMRVQNICLQAQHDQIPESEALESLIEQERILKLADYEYVAEHGKYEALVAWARNKVQELSVNAPMKTKRGRPARVQRMSHPK